MEFEEDEIKLFNIKVDGMENFKLHFTISFELELTDCPWRSLNLSLSLMMCTSI